MGKGHFYPLLCLQARSDAGYREVRFDAYQDQWPSRVIALPPIRVEAAPPEASMTSTYVARRLRIAGIDGGSAQLVLEDAAVTGIDPGQPAIRRVQTTSAIGSSAPLVQDTAVAPAKPGQSVDAALATADYRLSGSLTLPLREGASAAIAGITVSAQSDGAGWKIVASGSFAPFTRLSNSGTTVGTFRPAP